MNFNHPTPKLSFDKALPAMRNVVDYMKSVSCNKYETLFITGWVECNGTHRLWKCGGFRYTPPTLQKNVNEQIEKVLTTFAVL